MDAFTDGIDPARLAACVCWRRPDDALAELLGDGSSGLERSAEVLRRRLALVATRAAVAEALAVELYLAAAAERADAAWNDVLRRVRPALVRGVLAAQAPAHRALSRGGATRRRRRLAVLVDREPLERVARRERVPPGLLVRDLRAALAAWSPTRVASATVPAVALGRLEPSAGGARRGARLAAGLAALAAELASPAAPTVAGALVRLDRRRAERTLAALDALLAATLAGAAPERGFASWTRRHGRPKWSLLAGLGAHAPAEPRPNEPPAPIARRLLAARARLDRGLATELWRARIVALERGPRAALEALPAPVRADGARARRLLLRERVELCLDAGLVRAAHAALGGQPIAVTADPVLPRLAAWTEWARGVGRGPAPPVEPDAPARLVEAVAVEDVLGDGSPVFGPDRPTVERDDPRGPEPGDAARLGAVLLVCVDARGRPVWHDDAAGRPLPAAQRGWPQPGPHPERLERRDCVVLPVRRATRTVLLAPLNDPVHGRVGHAHVEFDHRLAPTARELGPEVERWTRLVVARRGEYASTVADRAGAVASKAIDRDRDRPLARAAERHTAAIAEAAQWWLVLEPRGDDARTLAGAGAAQRTGGLPAALARAVDRLVGGGAAEVRVEGGAAVVLGDGTVWVGRARSPRGVDGLARAMRARAARLAAALDAARLAEALRARRGWTPLIGVEGGGAAFTELERLARGPWPAVVHGPPGSGRRTAARAALALAGALEPVVVGAGDRRSGADAAALIVLARQPAPEVVARLERRRGPSVLVADSVEPRYRACGTPSFDCAPRRERRALRPASLFALLAHERRCAVPACTPDASRALWRAAQRLELGALRGLVDAALDGVVLEGALGAALDVDDLRRAGDGATRAALARCPSRAPAPDLLRAALFATRTAGGRVNKRAAARLLGWDVGTLGRRLEESSGLHPMRASVRNGTTHCVFNQRRNR